MKMIIHTVAAGSVAEALGFQAGDQVTHLNGKDNLRDLFDYQLEVTDSEYLEISVHHTNGSDEIYEIEKDPDEDLGITFTSPIFTPIKTCTNACPFCFIDQQPKGLRPNLYIKDDDWRLSYFSNTYITLTNLNETDRERMSMIRPGPLYVSVHSTVPYVRQQLLVNEKAGLIMQELHWLKSLGIPFHCQIVVCPGINDGESLTQTLHDLETLRPEALSVAVVPLGLTQYRDHLPSLIPVDQTTAQEVVERVHAFQAEYGKEFVFISDEFYFKAGLPLPSYNEYGDFPQLDDGVGTTQMLLQEFYELEPTLPQQHQPTENLLILTGPLGMMTLQPIVTRLNEIDGLYVDLMAIESRFWGNSVGVTGLITGQDILEALQPLDLSGYRSAIIPSVMLKQHTDEFLDSKTVHELAETLQLPFQIVKDPYSGKELLETVFQLNV